MAQNVTIAGASYPDVPSIEVPKAGGGTAVFVDTSDANAVAGDITKGKTAYVGGTKITGTLEASSSGGAKETWVIKSDAAGEFATTQIAFTSNGRKFTSIGANYDGTVFILQYDNNEIATFTPGASAGYEFYNEAYRKLTFDTPPTGDLLTWLQSNGVKQPDDTAIQDTKALTITSNGTVSVTPDAPYDALKKVDVTVNVPKIDYNTIASTWEKHDFEFNGNEEAEISATGTATGLFAVLSENDTTSFIVFTAGNSPAGTAAQLAISGQIWSFNAVDNGVRIMVAGTDAASFFYATPYIYIQTT